MLRQLMLIHQSGSGHLEAPHWLEVKTCLRSFWVGFRSWPRPALPQTEGLHWEILEGLEAYRALVEISCGLRSPVLGETEVFGQIRRACAAYSHPDSSWHQHFQKVIQKLYADVKVVRTRHLTNLGAKSYGSYARKFFKDCSSVRILGAGQLTQEILPWLAKSSDEVIVHSRRPCLWESAPSNVKFQDYENITAPLKSGLLVAAPLSAVEVEEFLLLHNLKADRILDLREQSARDPISLRDEPYAHESLADVFQSFEQNKANSERIKEDALNEVQGCVRARRMEMEFRPDGWDDKCAG